MKDEGERLRAALRVATDALLAEIGAEGYWRGELSSSALSTATAVTALAEMDRGLKQSGNAKLIARGLEWLAAHRNADGGWGDTIRSRSNISTTALCWAAFGAAGADANFRLVVNDAVHWLERNAVAENSENRTGRIISTIENRYGKDRTFSVPILMTLAIAQRIGWERVIPLPFELAALPHQFFGALRLPVVSYALPALIAIGQTIHFHAPTRNPLARLIRGLSRKKTLRVLESIQPDNGGFLEATPLTSFVTMSLASMGLANHTVARKGATFLRESVRADGSWPIDTNLCTWVTTLAIKALSHQAGRLSPEQKLTLREWLLDQQYRVEHPYTHAAAGGWAWTDLPGGVPDADDTAGALLALLALGGIDERTQIAGEAGLKWLLDLQNRDGGIPTFCRGWGALPFDRSAPDLTAHAVRAWSAWRPHVAPAFKLQLERGIARAVNYLAKTQRADGAWLPLWFGNEHAVDEENPIYGTSHVVIALREVRHRGFELPDGMENRAIQFLVAAQGADGGWGGGGSIEETALAVEALAGTAEVSATDAGLHWLIERIESDAWREAAPIGFYFAKLWYFERLYPLIFTVGALGKGQ